MVRWSDWVTAKLEDVHEEVQAMRAEIGDDRRFLIEMNRRSEIAFVGMMRALERLERKTEESIRITREIADDMRDTREATRAHTRAVLSLLDRFDDGAAPAGGSA